MKLIADLQIHSRFSRATSKNLTLPNIEKYAKIKGLSLLGTGDFTHPEWNKELKEQLTDDGSGILASRSGFKFVLQGEISNMYTQDGKGRRIHTLLLAPSFDIVDQINSALLKKGRLDYDGRPIFGFSCIELVEMMRDISKDIEIIPAHSWTPWFGIFGSMTGFNSVEECFKDQTKHIYAIETGLSCYDIETEVLTNNGWKKFSELKYSNKICTLNFKTNEIEFQYPKKIFKYDYKGKMYRLKTKRIDLLVTPNHKLFVTTCDFRNPKPFFLKEAELLFKKSKRFKKNGIWKGKNKKYFILPSVKIKHGSRFYKGLRNKQHRELPMEDWLKFFGFWIAEGWTSDGNRGDYNICISNKNEKLISEIKQILENFGYKTYFHKKNYTLRVRDYQLFSYLKQFGKCYDKFIPLDIKELSKPFLEILLEYYIKGDGHIYGRTKKGLSATTTSIRLRDDLQEIALKIGFSAYYKLHNKKGTLFRSPSQKSMYKQRNDSWVIYFIRQNIHTVLPYSIKKFNYIEKWVDFKGKVYCVSVPNQVIYVRRNGIPVWCGNSDPAMNWRLSSLDNYTLLSSSDAHSFWPWRLGREANVFDIEPSYKNLINAIRTKKGFVETIEVDPNYGKYHFDGHRNCSISLSPEESKKRKGICPKCRQKLTIGVLNRVEELADRPEGYAPENAVPFKSLVPLSEIISAIAGSPVASKKVWVEYYNLINPFENEFNILLNIEKEELLKHTNEKIANAIILNRDGKIKIKPGYDGVYGELILGEAKKKEKITTEKERKIFSKNNKQKGLEEFI